MNLLKMAQKARQLSGYQGSGPSSVDTTGYEAIFITLVKDIWEDIQKAKRDWKWMQSEVAFLTVVNQTEYSLTNIFGLFPRFRRWKKYNSYILRDGKKIRFNYVDYDIYKLRYLNPGPATPPSEWTIRPSDNAILIPAPDAVYAIYLEYTKSSQELTLATDVPEMPSEYHQLIVYAAVAEYAAEVGMPNIEMKYSDKAQVLSKRLMRDQVPSKEMNVRGVA